MKNQLTSLTGKLSHSYDKDFWPIKNSLTARFLLFLFFVFLFFFQMASKFSDITTRQVRAQRNRLIAARNVDQSEKRMYIKVYMCLMTAHFLVHVIIHNQLMNTVTFVKQNTKIDIVTTMKTNQGLWILYLPFKFKCILVRSDH